MDFTRDVSESDKVIPISDHPRSRVRGLSLLMYPAAAIGAFFVVSAGLQMASPPISALPQRVAQVNSQEALPVCAGGDRAARRLTCIVDGDTGWEVGVKWRLLNIDTPEISSPECQAEYDIGIRARDRLRALMGSGYQIDWAGERGGFGRELVNVRLQSGQDAGQILIQDGLAQPWPNEGNIWCR